MGILPVAQPVLARKGNCSAKQRLQASGFRKLAPGRPVVPEACGLKPEALNAIN
jgi:hypothetical protein